MPLIYEIGEEREGGYAYRIELCFGALCGWRKGTRHEVEAHVRKVARSYAIRSRGEVIKKYRDGSRRATRNGKSITRKEQAE